MPQSICNYPGCNQRIPFRSRYCDQHKKKTRLDDSREKYSCREWAYLYKRKSWLERRRRQLMKQPLCEECMKRGRVSLATVADHVEDHKGDLSLFLHGELQSLCFSCHSIKTNKDHSNSK